MTLHVFPNRAADKEAAILQFRRWYDEDHAPRPPRLVEIRVDPSVSATELAEIFGAKYRGECS